MQSKGVIGISGIVFYWSAAICIKTENRERKSERIHFSDEMWEKTREGKRRLKSAAVPTIFGNRLVPVSTSVQEPMNIPAECHKNYNNTSQEAQEDIPINNGDVHNEFAGTEETQIETEGREITEKFEETPFAKNI